MQTTDQLIKQLSQSTIAISKLEEDKLSSQQEDDPRAQNGLELNDQFNQLRTFRSEELEEISEVDNNEVSTPSDHYTQLNQKLIVEPLMTLIEPLLKKKEATIGDPETLPQHIEYIDLNLLKLQLILQLYLDQSIKKELLVIRRMSHIMVPSRKYLEEELESRRELQTHIKIRTEIG